MPVKSPARAGVLLGEAEYPFTNKVPSFAKRSRFGDMTAEFPISREHLHDADQS